MPDQESSSNSNKATRRVLICMAAIGSVATIFTVVPYLMYFSANTVSADPEQWGQFGDYFGGVLNPIMSFLALLGLLWTIYQNQKELAMTREELRKSSEALEASKEIAAREERRLSIKEKKDEIMKVINILNDEIDSLLRPETVEKNTGHLDSTINLIKRITRIPDHCTNSIILYLRTLTVNINKLTKYLLEYEKLTGEQIISDYFRFKLSDVVNNLFAVPVLEKHIETESSVVEFYTDSDSN